MWTPFAIVASEQGLFTNPIWWPFLFIFPILCICFCSSVARQYLRQRLREIFRVLLGTTLGLLTYFALIWLRPPFGMYFAFVAATLSICYFLAMSAMMLLNTYSTFRDQQRFVQWLRIPIKQITGQKLLHLLSLYQSNEYSKKLIVSIREKNALIASEDSESLIKELALTLERMLKDSPTAQNLISSDFLHQWIKRYNRKDESRLKKLGDEFLDELYATLEQIHSQRKAFDSGLK
jgi:hypothetical protein